MPVASGPRRPGRPAPRRSSPPATPSRRSRSPVRPGAPHAGPHRCRPRTRHLKSASAPPATRSPPRCPHCAATPEDRADPRRHDPIRRPPSACPRPERRRAVSMWRPASPAPRPYVQRDRAAAVGRTACHATFRAVSTARSGGCLLCARSTCISRRRTQQRSSSDAPSHTPTRWGSARRLGRCS